MEAVAEILWPLLCATLRLFCFLMCFPWLRSVLGQSGILVLSASMLGWCIPHRAAPRILPASSSGSDFFTSLCMESLCGVLLALPFVFFGELFLNSARIADVLRGAQTAEQLAPEQGERVSLSPALVTVLFGVFAFCGGGYQPICKLLQESFEKFPAGKIWSLPVGMNSALLQLRLLIVLSGETLRTAVFLTLPFMVASLIWDIGSGFLSRSLRGLNLLGEILAWKSLLGMMLLLGMFTLGEKPATLLFAKTVRIASELLR